MHFTIVYIIIIITFFAITGKVTNVLTKEKKERCIIKRKNNKVKFNRVLCGKSQSRVQLKLQLKACIRNNARQNYI